MSAAPPRAVPAADFALERAHRAVLDVRGEDEFARGHPAQCGHVPHEALAERRAELPARDTSLLIVAREASDARSAAETLAARGFADVAWLDAPLASAPGGIASSDPPIPLWRAAPFLEEVLPQLGSGRALDLASGSGREAVFLALRGFEVEAWDHAAEALARARELARRHGVSITTVERDLEAGDPGLPREAFDLVVCFRYLHRPLFGAIERALKPGGWLVYETFRSGQERHGPPHRPRFLLRDGELSSAFPSLSVVRYAELEPAGGPVTARLLARKPRSGA